MQSKTTAYKFKRARNRESIRIWRHISRILRSYGIVPNLATVDQDLKDIEGTYSSGAFYTLWHGERLIGTAAFRMISPRHAEIGRMYLSKKYRGQGLGRRLLKRVTEAAVAKGATLLSLKTAAVLKEAIGLYAASGFVVQDRQACGNCNLSMVKRLKPVRKPSSRRVGKFSKSAKLAR